MCDEVAVTRLALKTRVHMGLENVAIELFVIFERYAETETISALIIEF